jgi:hypothetical protein
MNVLAYNKENLQVKIHYLIRDLQYQPKVWTHILIQEFFFILTIFYIVE